jgi:acetolactate synthase-1/3 small subunit
MEKSNAIRNIETLVMILENTPGVLTRICEIVSNRGYNIESLNVNTFDVQSTDNKKEFKNSKITIEINMPKIDVEKLKKQLSKIIGVKYFLDFFEEDYLIRELMLLTVSFHDGLFNEESVFKIYNARIIDVGTEYIHLEVINTPEILTKFFNYLKKQKYHIVDIIRSGKIIIEKKDQDLDSTTNLEFHEEKGKSIELKFPSKDY